MAASSEGGAAVFNFREVSAGRDIYIKVDTAVQDEPFRRNRYRMLEKVRLIWIKGLLEPSLDQLARIELGLEPKPDAVNHAYDLQVQRPEQAPYPLPTGTPISHVFDEAGKALLILGEPGAGKTTLLLELTRDLLDRAVQDERHLIPVIFHLSSWAEQRLALADWLVDELNKRYDVPHKLAKAWVDAEILLPLLDGLDEVAAEHREACVETINAFVNEHGLLPLVVCSRVADYAALTVRLRVPSAVLIQALRRQQVQHYVEQAGAALVGLRTVLQHDESLWELLNTPLMLSIAALAYQGRAADEIRSSDTLESHRTQLFAAYTDAMFHRRARTTPYLREQTEHWLMWLARAMKDHHQSIFYLERMQPNWVTEAKQQKSIEYILGLMHIMLLGVLIGGVSVLDGELPLWTFGIMSVFGMLNWLLQKDTPIRRLWARLAPFPLMSFTEIKPIEKILRWSWSAVRFKRLILFAPLTTGLLGGLLVGVFSNTLDGLLERFYIGLLTAVFVGLAVGIFASIALFTGFTTGEIEVYSFPNEGIKRSGRNGLIIGLFFWLLAGLGKGQGSGSLIGLMLGLYLGLAVGGEACLHHFALRLVLWHNNFAPLSYIRFLDYAAGRIFLRKVGGGYVFIHRMLLEYFAARLCQISAEQRKLQH